MKKVNHILQGALVSLHFLRSGLAVWLLLLLAAPAPATAQQTPGVPTNYLLNVDYGSGGGRGYSLKTGWAAVGMATNDFWNFYDRDISPGVWRNSGALTNLTLANGVPTTVGMSVSDAPGEWGGSSSDPMYENYIYPLDTGNNVVTFTNLPAGQYDVLVYSPDGNTEVIIGGTSCGVKTSYDPSYSGAPVWTEGVQYARWRNVIVGAGQPLALACHPNTQDKEFVAGVQILGSMPAPPCSPPASGLVSWWPGEGNGNDIIGTNNGVLEGGISFGPGEVGEAFLFTNASADARIPASASLDVGTGGGFTVEAWIDPSDVSQLHPIVEWNNDGAGWGAHFYISTDAGPGSFYANVVDSGGGWHEFHSSIAPLTTNVFQHVALTYDQASGVGTIYCNGAVVAQEALGSFTPLTSYDLYLGRRPPTGGETFTFAGLMDEVSLYNRALSSNEIATIYDAGSAGKCPPVPTPPPCDPAPAGIVAWWPAEGNADDIIGTNNGYPTGGIGYTNGEVGQAFVFNGSTSYIPIPASPSLNIGSGGGFTIECWIEPWATALGGPLIEWDSASTDGAQFWVQSDYSLYTNAKDTSGNDHRFATASGAVKTNTWQHVALTYDQGSGWLLFYTNGAVAASENAGSFTAQTTYALNLGRRTGQPIGNGDTFGGLMDELSLYNRALSSNEIAAIYQAGTAGKCPPTPTGPTIITQPTNQVVTVGGNASFSVVAAGTPPLSYQWSSNTTNIVEATNATLALTNVQFNQSGNYSVLVTNLYGSLLSSNALLTVISPTNVPVIISFAPPLGQTGTVVNIRGLNFSPVASNNIVYFGAVRAAVSAASATNLIVTVPVGATFAPITETVNGMTAYADAPFLPTFPGSGPITSASLGPQFTLPTGSGPTATIIADLDGDGKPDLAVVNTYDHTIYVYRNISTNGILSAGSFAPPVVLSLGTGGDNALAVGDLTGDGKLDFVFVDSNSNVVSVLKNLCTPGNITTNSFGPRINFAVGSQPRGVAVQDLDGDGRPEIIVGNWNDSTISVLRNTSVVGSLTTNSFAPALTYAAGTGPQNVVIADLDGDGQPDVITVNKHLGSTDGGVSIFRNTSSVGNISFAPRVDLAGPIQCYSLVAADIDGDGRPDLVFVSFNYGEALSVYRNLSTPGNLTTNSFATRVDLPLGAWGNGVAMGDVNGDGKPDVAVVTQLPDHFYLFQNPGTAGSFTTNSLAGPVGFSAGYNPNGVAIGDLDGDGRPDMVFGNTYDNTLSIYQNLTPIGAGLHFVWNPIPSPRFAGAPFAVTVQAENSANGLATNFTGEITLMTTNSVPVKPGSSGNFTQGIWTGTITIGPAGTNLVLEASDSYGENGMANPINVVNLPMLTAVPSSGTLVIGWPANMSGFVLETSPNLMPGSWVPVGTPPIQIGGQNLELITITGANAFYRLRFTGP